MMTLDEIKTVAEAVCAEKMPGAYVTFRESAYGTSLEIRKDEDGVPYGFSMTLDGEESEASIVDKAKDIILALDINARIRALQPITPEKLEAWGNKPPFDGDGVRYLKYKDERGEFRVSVIGQPSGGARTGA